MKNVRPGLDGNSLFTLALGLASPWEVVQLNLDATEKRLDIKVDFAPGSTFPCPECGAACKVQDTSWHTWRHLNFFEHVTYIEARQPRAKCGLHGVLTVDVPWAREGSRFTLMFEAFVLELARNGLTVKAIERMIGENDTLIWRMLEHYVEEARARADFGGVTAVGVDEASRQKNHVYVTIFADMLASKVLFVTEGKDHATVADFKGDLVAHGGSVEQVNDFSLDMSQAFIKGIQAEFPCAYLTFDRFHVVQLMNDAVDEVRRKEQKGVPELKGTRYDWIKNEVDVEPGSKPHFDALRTSKLATARAYHSKTMLQELYEQPADEAEAWFDRWYFWATHSRLKPVVRVAKTLRAHQAGLMRWFVSGLSNGLLEGLNSLIQAAKARARGFRSARKMKTIIYLLLSKLDFRLPCAIPNGIHSR